MSDDSHEYDEDALEFIEDERVRIAALHATCPKEIWLQIDPEAEQFDGLDAQTWCSDKINETDVRYVLAASRDAYIERLETGLLQVRKALCGDIHNTDDLLDLIASRDAEIARLKTVPMRYRRMAFNAQLQDEVTMLEQENDQLHTQIKQKDAEIAELVEALEDNWNCNPCETTRQQKAFDVAQSVLAKVRKP